jgi:DNA helicase-2/ATP-dependent DNA helicase PcrA
VTPELKAALERLSPTQRKAVDWGDGAALVLAGPGVGKTTVLTTRVARILDETPKKNFRILALTFTTKAGDEMRTRIEQLVPGMNERVSVGTFHSFCAQVLRQHGSHLGIKPDFGVYEQQRDFEELLKDGLTAAVGRGEPVSVEDYRLLPTINQLRANLVGPKKAAARFGDAKTGERVARAYDIYERTLRERNVLDFNGMILDTCRLAHEVPAVAARVRQTHPFWLIDEFQDTSPAQYRMVKFLAGADFKNVFAVADDDQIIYQWAGASYQQIVKFREEFDPELIQLVENRRCPPDVVEAANNLVAHNKDRTPGKEKLVSLKEDAGRTIAARVYDTDKEEAEGIATEIAAKGNEVWGKIVVLGRTRATLQPILVALRAKGVTAALATRRDGFVSPNFNWLYSTLDQACRPSDRRVFAILTNAANATAGIELNAELLIAEAEAAGKSFLEQWSLSANSLDNSVAKTLGGYAMRLVQSRANWKAVLGEALPYLTQIAKPEDGLVSDASEDRAAWDMAAKAIRAEKGTAFDLSELLQGIALRPKEPPPDPNAVSLSTVHAAKGLEFDHVWLAGLAEDILPSWQSLKRDARPGDLEEERRNCFVAITRTKMSLTLSRAKSYQGRLRVGSRFITEMGVAE